MSYAFIAFIERAAIAIVIVFVGLLFGANAAMKGLGIYLLIWGLLFGLNRLLDALDS